MPFPFSTRRGRIPATTAPGHNVTRLYPALRTLPGRGPAPEIDADPYPGAIAACLAANAGWTEPLDCREIVTDDTLRRFARGDTEFVRGVIPEDLAAEIAMLLPDIAGELLARRRGADLDAARQERQARQTRRAR